MDDAGSTVPVVTSVDLGRELKRWLRHGRRRGMKVSAVASRLGVSQSTMYAYLAGSTLPSTEVLDDLLRELGVPAPEQRRLATARDALQRDRRGRTSGESGVSGSGRAATAATTAIESELETPTPRELPAEPGGFLGRETELAALRKACHDPNTGIAVLAGTGGVGKTALAVRFGHAVAERFDGCLYADLLGFSPNQPLAAEDVLARFLRSLGIDDAAIPRELSERAVRFRSLLAGRSMLLLLDNAANSEQVLPLLPGDPGSFVLVTSRDELAGLRVRAGGRLIRVAPLGSEDGKLLLRSRIDPDVSWSEPAARTLVEHSGGLPLALRILAAQARPNCQLHELAARLDGEQVLDTLTLRDADACVRTVFSWSERRLAEPAADAFRRLGIAVVRDFDQYAAAAALETSVSVARDVLRDLMSAQLLEPGSAPGRFRMHDLVRTYARERAIATLDETERTAIAARLADYYLTAGAEAIRRVHPPGANLQADWLVPVEIPELPDRPTGKAWLDSEWANLLSLLEFALEHGLPDRCLRLAALLRRRLVEGVAYADGLVVHGSAVTAARLLGDRVAEGVAMHHLGMSYTWLGRMEEAERVLLRALEVCRSTGDSYAEAGALNHLGIMYERSGRFEDAVRCYREALPVARTLGFRHGEAALLTNIGFACGRLGQFEQAVSNCRRALELHEEIGDPGGIANALGNLGEACRLDGRPEEALRLFDQALTQARSVDAVGVQTEVLNYIGSAHLAGGATEQALAAYRSAEALARDSGDRYEQAHALRGIGRCDRAAGRTDSARERWSEALRLYRALRMHEAREVEDLLGSL